MSALLRATGTNFDVDRYCLEAGLSINRVFRRGDPVYPRSQPKGRTLERSGVTVVVSEADMDQFERQVDDTVTFLRANGEEVRRLVGFPGVEEADIDFGIELRDVMVHCDWLPPELLALAGSLGLGLELSHYPRRADGEERAE